MAVAEIQSENRQIVMQEAGTIIEWCALADMFIDRSFQRNLREQFSDSIANAFDPKLLGILQVNLRDDSRLSVIDGQHRFIALKHLGRTEALCEVHAITPTDEARLFVELQKRRRSVSPLDRHKALGFANDPQALAIDAALDAHGFRVNSLRIHGGISAVNVLTTIHETYGVRVLAATLKVISDAWGLDESDSRRGPMVHGLAMFLQVYGEKVDHAVLVKRLQLEGASRIIGRARAHHRLALPMEGSGPMIVAREVRSIYNKGRRGSGVLKPQVAGKGKVGALL